MIMLAAGVILLAEGGAESRHRYCVTQRTIPMPQRTTKGRRTEPPVIEGFFIGGAALVVVSLMYSLAKSWPSFDPLALSALVGGGLLLVVICERLSLILRELRRITELMQRSASDPEPARAEKR